MTIKEYRRLKGYTQPELARVLRTVVDGIDAPLISKMERGICEPPIEIQAYIDSEERELGFLGADLTPSQEEILMAVTEASFRTPVTREELCLRTGNSDRMNRKDINAMRNMGMRIVADNVIGGYYFAEDENDYKVLRNEYIKRIKSLAKTLKAMDGYCKGQERING